MILNHRGGFLLLMNLGAAKQLAETSVIVPDGSRGGASWRGKLHLCFTRRDLLTQLSYAEASAPLKMQRPFYPEGDGVCHSVILHTAGGLVGGDHLTLDIQLAAETHALVTTAAASKIYRSNGSTATQITKIYVGAGACLEWFPQDAIAFNGCNYLQDVRIELGPGAAVFLWDVMRFGRSAAGEKFSTGQLRSRLEVWQQGRPLWIDRQQLLGNARYLGAPNAFADCSVLGCFAYLGREIPPELIQEIREQDCPELTASDWGVTRLPKGLVGRYRGHSSRQALAGFVTAWNRLRQHFHQRSACPPRVWPF